MDWSPGGRAAADAGGPSYGGYMLPRSPRGGGGERSRSAEDRGSSAADQSAAAAADAPASTLTEAEEAAIAEWNDVNRWGLMTSTIANYRRIEQIGEGTYGQVYRAQCLKNGRPVALKKIRVHHGGYWGMPPTVIREIKILKALHHPHMVEMIEVVSSKGVEYLDEDDEREDERRKKRKAEHAHKLAKDHEQASGTGGDSTSSPILGGGAGGGGSSKKSADSGKKSSGSDAIVKLNSKKSARVKKSKDRIVDAREGYKGNLFIVLEYVSHDLTGLMDMAYKFTEVEIKCVFRQLLEVLSYMHENKYVHRDIKSSNILIDSHFRVKLADFGLARCIAPPILENPSDEQGLTGGNRDLTNKVITLWYRPPELLLGETRYGCAVDIWSAGCILAELILGRPLFTGKSEMEQLGLIFDMIGTPTDQNWEGFRDLKLIRTGEVTIDNRKPGKLRKKYEKRMKSTELNLVEKLLELDPNKRLTAKTALTARYFRSEPIAPDDPAELGKIDLGEADDGSGNFHEFQTKKRRREAKAVAQKASEAAKRVGQDEKDAYDQAYKDHMQKSAREEASAKKALEAAEKKEAEKRERREREEQEAKERPRSSHSHRDDDDKKREHSDRKRPREERSSSRHDDDRHRRRERSSRDRSNRDRSSRGGSSRDDGERDSKRRRSRDDHKDKDRRRKDDRRRSRERDKKDGGDERKRDGDRSSSPKAKTDVRVKEEPRNGGSSSFAATGADVPAHASTATSAPPVQVLKAGDTGSCGPANEEKRRSRSGSVHRKEPRERSRSSPGGRAHNERRGGDHHRHHRSDRHHRDGGRRSIDDDRRSRDDGRRPRDDDRRRGGGGPPPPGPPGPAGHYGPGAGPYGPSSHDRPRSLQGRRDERDRPHDGRRDGRRGGGDRSRDNRRRR